MLVRRLLLPLAAAGLAAAPIAGASASPARVATPVTDAQYQDGDRGRPVSVALILATIVLLLIAVAAISADGDPASP